MRLVDPTVSSSASRVPDYGERLRIGMILPNRNIVAEADAHAILPPGVSIHTTRLRLEGTTAEDLLGMAENVDGAARLLGAAPLGLIVFHCTAVSTYNAEMGARLVARIERISGKPAIATSQALIAALNALDARRIVMLTPYSQAINDAEVAYFKPYGIEVLREVALALPSTVSTASVKPEEWRERMLALRRADADAYFLSCTNIRAVTVIDALERTLEAPVISSNQAMLWHALRTSNIGDSIAGYGRLLTAH